MVNVRKGWIKVRAEIDRMGGLLLSPVSKEFEAMIIGHLFNMSDLFEAECMMNSFLEEGVRSYTQFEQDVDMVLFNDVPKRKHKELREGYPVTFLMDPWIFAHFFGFDAHTLFESAQYRSECLKAGKALLA